MGHEMASSNKQLMTFCLSEPYEAARFQNHVSGKHRRQCQQYPIIWAAKFPGSEDKDQSDDHDERPKQRQDLGSIATLKTHYPQVNTPSKGDIRIFDRKVMKRNVYI